MPVPIIHIFETGDYESQVRRGIDALNAGGLVVLPTETVYGAAGLLTHAEARRRLAALRGGDSPAAPPENKPFTVHLSHAEQARRFLGDVGDLGRRLMRKLWPGPVALVFEVPPQRRQQVAAALGVAESDLYDPRDGSITLRCPDHIVAMDVIAGAAGPVVMTLAGTAGSSASWSAQGMAEELDHKVDLIFDAGPARYSKPSTVLRLKSNADGSERYEVVRQGIYDQRIIDRLLRTTILFVCSGNTCRSPMAEAIARRVLARKLEIPESDLEKKGINVTSAGAYAMPGNRATPAAVEAVRGLGADLSSHRSRQLTPELIHQADVIFAMGRGHAAAVAMMAPTSADKVTTLDPEGDIEDPIGGDVTLYQNLAGQLQALIEKRLEEIK